MVLIAGGSWEIHGFTGSLLPPNRTSLRTEDVPPIDDHRTKPMQYQPVDEQGGKEEEEEEEEEEEKEEEEEEKTDSVMRKYMEIVSQRREQQKVGSIA